MTEQKQGARRQAVSLRFDAGLRDRVAAVALREGRTLNEMVNVLIERGLAAERQQTVAFGSPAGSALAHAIINAAEMATVRHGGDGGLWFYEPESYDQAAAAMKHTIDQWHPKAREHQEHLAALATGKRNA